MKQSQSSFSLFMNYNVSSDSTSSTITEADASSVSLGAMATHPILESNKYSGNKSDSTTKPPGLTFAFNQQEPPFVVLLADPDAVVTDSIPIVYYGGPYALQKQKISKVLSEPLVEVVMCVAVLFSSLLVALSTLSHLSRAAEITIQWSLTAVGLLCAADFSARWFASPKDRFKHMLHPSFLLDLVVVICPLIFGRLVPPRIRGAIPFIPNWLVSPGALINLQLLRVLRLQRILKDLDTFSKFETAVGLTPNASLTKDWQLQLARVLSSLFTLLSVSSGLIYTAECSQNPAMTDYFTALYFGLTTLTTVGFGDIVPVTWLGKLIVSGSILAGVAVVPAQAAAMVEALLARQEEDKKAKERNQNSISQNKRPQSKRLAGGMSETTGAITTTTTRKNDNRMAQQVLETTRACPCCDAVMHWANARYCWSCGESL
jgi:hypothetical protein